MRCRHVLCSRFQVLSSETGADFDRLSGKSKFYARFRQMKAVSFCNAIVNWRVTGYHRRLYNARSTEEVIMDQQETNLVEVRGVSFSRGDRPIFDDISLTVPKGKVTAIMGPSGIGKTTLLRLIGGQLQPDRGEIWFRGENIPSLSRAKLYETRKKNEHAVSVRCAVHRSDRV
ncbi:ATP-binding cassette domain-containing protein [Pantoea tagorei]